MKLGFAFVFALSAGICGTVFTPDVCAQTRNADSGPMNESAFLHEYQPGSVLRPFYLPNEPCTWGSSYAGRRPSLDFQSDCIIKANLEKQLIDAIQAEILRCLEVTHAHVTQKQEEPNGGYRYTFKTGNGVGSVIVDPLEHPLVQRDKPLSEGLEDVRIKLKVEERWSE